MEPFHLYHRQLCQRLTWQLKRLMDNQVELKQLFIPMEFRKRIPGVSSKLTFPTQCRGRRNWMDFQFGLDFNWLFSFESDALHLSIPAQGLPNGDAALQHAAYPGMQPYPGVGKFETLSQHFLTFDVFD